MATCQNLVGSNFNCLNYTLLYAERQTPFNPWRLNIAVNGFWGGQFKRTFFDVWLFSPHAPSNRHPRCYRKHKLLRSAIQCIRGAHQLWTHEQTSDSNNGPGRIRTWVCLASFCFQSLLVLLFTWPLPFCGFLTYILPLSVHCFLLLL